MTTASKKWRLATRQLMKPGKPTPPSKPLRFCELNAKCCHMAALIATYWEDGTWKEVLTCMWCLLDHIEHQAKITQAAKLQAEIRRAVLRG